MSNQRCSAAFFMSRRFGGGSNVMPRLVSHWLSVLVVWRYHIQHTFLRISSRLQFNHYWAHRCRNKTICASQQRSNVSRTTTLYGNRFVSMIFLLMTFKFCFFRFSFILTTRTVTFCLSQWAKNAMWLIFYHWVYTKNIDETVLVLCCLTH